MALLSILEDQSLIVHNIWVFLDKGLHSMLGVFHVATGEPELKRNNMREEKRRENTKYF